MPEINEFESADTKAAAADFATDPADQNAPGSGGGGSPIASAAKDGLKAQETLKTAQASTLDPKDQPKDPVEAAIERHAAKAAVEREAATLKAEPPKIVVLPEAREPAYVPVVETQDHPDHPSRSRPAARPCPAGPQS